MSSVLTEISGQEVKYTPIEIPAFEKMMKEKGLPESMVRKIADFNEDIKNGTTSIFSEAFF